MTLRRIAPWVFLTFFAAIILGSTLAATPAYAQGMLYPGCTGIDCQLCNLVSLVDKLIKYLIYAAAPIAACLFAYAGFLYLTSGGNVSAAARAKTIFKDILFGAVLALIGFLIVDTVIQSVAAGYFKGPSWSAVQCVAGRNILGSFGSNTTPTQPSTDPADIFTPVPDPGNPSSIASAADAYKGQSTVAGPDAGNLACAWAVNNVLKSAGIAPIDGDSVPAMENALQGGRGTLVSASTAQAGDIVIQGNDSHVGICMNSGCTQVISNSSSQRSFNWVSNTNFGGSVASRIYRVNK